MQVAKALVYTAVAAACIAVIMSAILSRIKRTKKESIRNPESGPGVQPSESHPPQPLSTKPAENSKGGRTSWANTFLPFYSLGILAYVMFVVGKIMNRKFSGARKEKAIKLSWNKQKNRKGNTKTKITMFELRQLEEKLRETEEAVHEILVNASSAMKAGANAIETGDSDEECSNQLLKRSKKSREARAVCSGQAEQWALGTENIQYGQFSDEDSLSEDEFCDSGNLPQLRRRRVKEVNDDKYPLPKKSRNTELSTESEVENELNGAHDSLEMGKYANWLKKRPNGDCIQVNNLKGYQQDSGVEQKKLIETAKDIQKTMLELQTYIDSKKIQCDGGD